MINRIRSLFAGLHDSYYEALRRRAKRNFRRLGDELTAILAEVLREEAEAIRREQEAEQNRQEVSQV